MSVAKWLLNGLKEQIVKKISVPASEKATNQTIWWQIMILENIGLQRPRTQLITA